MARGRGRPATIDRSRIVEAGIALTLPGLSIKAVARYLGVSEMTVYRHAGNLEGLRRMVGEGVHQRLELPPPRGEDARGELLAHARTVQDFVRAHPGSAPYLADIAPDHAGILARINAHQEAWARVYDWAPATASVVLSTVTSHALALSALFEERSRSVSGGNAPQAVRAGLELQARLGDPFTWSMGALIDGLLLWVAAADPRDPARQGWPNLGACIRPTPCPPPSPRSSTPAAGAPSRASPTPGTTTAGTISTGPRP